MEERSVVCDGEKRREYNVQQGDPGVILKGEVPADWLTVMHLIL